MKVVAWCSKNGEEAGEIEGRRSECEQRAVIYMNENYTNKTLTWESYHSKHSSSKISSGIALFIGHRISGLWIVCLQQLKKEEKWSLHANRVLVVRWTVSVLANVGYRLFWFQYCTNVFIPLRILSLHFIFCLSNNNNKKRCPVLQNTPALTISAFQRFSIFK